jgi:spermidine synthase
VANPAPLFLLAATFVIAVSGLIYELLAGTLSSYLLGDSVTQFSIVIGLFMTAMGVGAFISRYFQENLERAFTTIQIALGLAGGLSALILFYAFAYVDNYAIFLFLLCLLIGSLMGLEIPLITRILQQHQILKLNISNVLTADYIGALAAALLFPLVLVPHLGLMSTSLLFGLLNLSVAGMSLYIFRQQIPGQRIPLIASLAALMLLAALLHSEKLIGFFEQRLYQGEIVFAETTPYQRIILTRQKQRIRLFLNGNLQFDSHDEYRYHESLVHPAMSLARRKNQVLILGGGDGLAAREVLKYPQVERIVLVDLDPAITRLFRENALLKPINAGALAHPKVEIINQDAWKYLEELQDFFDVAIIDLPDPHSPSLSKLYTTHFYHRLASHLGQDGILVTQATSPFYARQAFWSIHHTLAATPHPYRSGTNLYPLAYHAYVPSFGEWGFILAGLRRLDWNEVQVPPDLRFLNRAMLPGLAEFAPDMQPLDASVNTLQDHALLRYYEQGWAEWF